jgi:aryl-alcohol dehydrogenase-like predicted oxidoreductase
LEPFYDNGKDLAMTFNEPTDLGRTGLKVGRLGISSSFGAPAAAYEAAFERGCNYFTWGTFIRGRSGAMREAIRNITAGGRRGDLVVAMLTYAHSAWLTEHFFIKGLNAAGMEYADVLLLGWFPRRPSRKIIDGATALKEKGLVRHIGLTSHNRSLFPELAGEGLFDIFHVRYNAAHRGAEEDVFPHITGTDRPGIVSFTATDWKKLLNPKKAPSGHAALTPAECYRFVLSNPNVDVCMMGAKNMEQMRENLDILGMGPLSESELKRVYTVGTHVYGK